ncbi:MAG: Asp23/Gls24 family envelope stress response protein [Bacilli bacterium]
MSSSNSKKQIDLHKIKNKEIAVVCKEAVMSCYGVVDISKIPSKINIPTITQNITKVIDGIEIKRYIDGAFSVTLNLVIALNAKISEILVEAQKTVLYKLNKAFPSGCKEVNLYAVRLA